VKWGALSLREARRSKDDTQREETKQRRTWGVGLRVTDTYYIISQQARATTQHANTQEVCMFFLGEGS
jgi:hypothetical protein